jgi:pyrroloquinoline-quinone synthase
MGEAPWPAQEFVERLREVVESQYHHRHPFNVRMHQGGLSQEEVRRWICNRFHYQRNLPVKDALVLSKLPRDERRRWLQRIIDHDGRQGDEGGIEAWLRLGEGAGLSREAMLDEARVLPGVRFAVDAYVNFCRLRPWREAVASSLTELLAPQLISDRITAFTTHYPWIAREALEYFRNRLTEGPRDAQHALDLVVQSCASREDQDRAIAAVSFKCDVLWALLDSVQQGDQVGAAPCPT